jgi:hypothetical protein
MFEVVGLENGCIFVRCRRTGETYHFEFGDDGALTHREARTDQGEARRVAIAYLYQLRRKALTV